MKTLWRRLKCFFSAALFVFSSSWARAEEVPENRFVYAQLRYSENWDPYPDLWKDVVAELVKYTSLNPWPERRVVSLKDPTLFSSPFLAVLGRGTVNFSDEEKENLRDYLAGGGFLFIDDGEARGGGPLSRFFLPMVEGLFPGNSWKPVPADNALYRSFFLLRRAAGRRIIDKNILGFWVGDRLVAIYNANDIHGALVRDPLGRYIYNCDPGGEIQREESMSWLINILIYSVTGAYKSDAIHQPFLIEKLKESP